MIGVVAVVFAFIAFFGSLLYVAYAVGRDQSFATPYAR